MHYNIEKEHIMKNLFLAAALVLGLAATAQTETTQTTQPQTTATVQATQVPSEQEKEYAKVKQDDIAPEVLKQAIAKYKGFELVEALKAEDGTDYKFVLTKDGKNIAAYFKSTGEFIKEVAA
jgi:uncharacterized lipoprotein YajG